MALRPYLVLMLIASTACVATLTYCKSTKVTELSFTKTHPAFIDQFFAALNSHDESALKKVLDEHFSSAIPVEQRMQNLLGVSADNGPFKVIEDGKAGPTEITIKTEDRDHQVAIFAFSMNTEGKVIRVMIRPEGESTPPKDYSGFSNLADLTHQVMTYEKCPAMGMAVIQNGKAQVAVDGVREIGKPDKVGPDEPWSIGSIGKPICSTIVALLIEQGKLRWDEPLGEALDVAKGTAYENVTLEQIMRHRGGIPKDMGMMKPQVDKIVGSAQTPSEQRLNYAKDILSRPPIGKPGDRMSYSNAGYALLSVVAEKASGMPYEQTVRELLFKPLGLTHSYIGSATWPNARPMGHIPGPNGLEPEEMTGVMESLFAGAGGGLYLSVGDLAKFGQMHLAGLKGDDGLLKSETVKHLHSIPDTQTGERYACGWGVNDLQVPGLAPFDGHNGSNGTFRAQLAIFPEKNLVVAAIVNCGGESEPSAPLQAAIAFARKG